MEPSAVLSPKRPFFDSQGYINLPKRKRTSINYFNHPQDFTAEQISRISSAAIKRLVTPETKNHPRINRAVQRWLRKANQVINHAYKAKIEKVCIAIIQRRIALSQGEEGGILNDLQFILSFKPKYVPALLACATVELRLKDNEEAALIAGRCLELDPDNPEALSIRAHARIRDKQFLNSFEDLFKALQSPLNNELRKRIDPVLNECIHGVRAYAGDSIFYGKLINALLKHKEIIVNALKRQMRDYYRSKNYLKALEIVDNCLFIDSSRETSTYRAAILIQMEQYLMAFKELQTERLGEKNSHYWALSGFVDSAIESRLGDRTNFFYKKALSLDPNNVIALHGLAAAFMKSRDYHSAMEYFAKVLDLVPNDAEAKESYDVARSLLSFREAYETNSEEKERKGIILSHPVQEGPRRILKPRVAPSVVCEVETVSPPAPVVEQPKPPGIVTKFLRALFKRW